MGNLVSAIRRLVLRVVTTFRAGRAERDLAREVNSHLALLEDQFRRGGMTEAAARAAARRAFGGVEQVKERQRDTRAFVWLDEGWRDLRYGFRAIRRAPAFAAAAIVTLAVGIGATTAIFSLLDTVLLKPLPLPEPQRLYFLAHGAGVPSLSANYPLFERYRANLTTFTGITSYNTRQFKVSTDAGTELVSGQFAAGNYHQVLRVPIALGRGFDSDSDRPADAVPPAVISDGYWRRRFGGDPSVIGRTFVAQGRTVSIVGVTAAGFHGLRPGTQVDVTLSFAQRAMDQPTFLTATDSWTSMYLVGRLKPGTTEAAALAEVQAIFAPFWSEVRSAVAKSRPPDEPHPAALTPAGRGSDTVRQAYREPLLLLMGMVTVVLVIACSNVANLLLARGAARTREMAVRASIGASRARLFRQLLTESMALAAAGGALGLLVATWGTRAIGAMLNVGTNPVLLDVDPDARVLAFTVLVSMLTAIVFGLAPAIRAARREALASLRALSMSSDRHMPFSGRALVVCQIALSMLLLAGGTLLVRSLVNLQSQHAGFKRENLLLFYLDARGSQTTVAAWQDLIWQRMREVPGVRTVAFSTMSPLATDEESRPMRIDDRPVRPVVSNRITADYFQAYGIPVLQGRGISAQDTATAPRVAVVNETMARDYFDGNAVGKLFALGAQKLLMTVVGVVGDNRQRSLRDQVPAIAYVPLAQAEAPPSTLTATLTIDGDPRAVEARAREVIRTTSPDLVMSYARTMRQQIEAALVRERLLAVLSIAFVAVAVFLAAIGLYGVLSYGVARRVRDIGIAMALGASREAVMWQVMRTTLALAATGIALGVLAAVQVTGAISSFLFGVSGRDPLTFAAAAVVLLLTSLAAGYLPARRATSIDPVQALRAE